MKFRTICLLFNIVIVVSFVFVFILPFALLGWDYSIEFWKGSWYLALVFLLLLGVLNGFFARNWQVFTLVEREDWSGLAAHLVERIFTKKRYGERQVDLLVDAYLLLGDIGGIERLEEELSKRRPDLLRRSAVLFGLTRILKDKAADAEAFLAPWLGRRDVDNWEWLRFDYAFALLRQGKHGEAAPQLLEGAGSRDAVLSLLAAYLLEAVIVPSLADPSAKGEAERTAAATKASLRKRFPKGRIEKEIERAKGEFQIVILSKLIKDAEAWLAT